MPPRPTPGPWAVLATASLAVFAVFLDVQVLFVAFGDLRADFPGATAASLSWVLSAYTIALAALLVPSGRLADRIGRKRVFLGASVVFTVASALCALAPNPESLVAFRVLQAVGAAGLTPASLALVLRAFPRPKVPVAVAVWGAVGAVAAAIGPTVGGLVVEHLGWRWVFLLNLPIGVLTVGAGRRILTESKEVDAGPVPDLVGTVLMAAAASLVALGVVQSDTWGWLDGRTVAALGGGAVVLAAFLGRSAGVRNPVLDLTLFRDRSFSVANAATFAFTLAFTAMFFANVQFLTTVWGYSVVRAGLALMPGPLVVVVLAPLFGRLAARVGQRALLVPGGVVYALAGVALETRVGAQPAFLTQWLPFGLIAGVAVALVLPQLSSAATQGLPPDRLAVGSAVNQTLRQLGSTFGVAVVVSLLGSGTAPGSFDRFSRAWWLLIAGGLATAAIAALLPRRTAAPAPGATMAPVTATG